MKKIADFLLGAIVIAVLWVGALRVMCFFYPISYKAEVEKYSRTYDVSCELVYAVIRAESKFDENALSKKGAVGLMQIMESTAEWAAQKISIEELDLYNPATNIEIGCFYLSYLLDMYAGNERCALAAYNAGPANVDRWLRDDRYSQDGKTLEIIPFDETDNYVEKVIKNAEKYDFLY